MKTTSLRILHTSDWHIGRTLYGRRRYETFSAFLDWLADTVRDRHVDVLIVAGDVFDTSAPSNRAQELYYRFLCRVMPFCRHIVVVAGNHDSPSFLTAPKELLRALNVHVVGSISDDPGHEILRLDGPDGEPELIVCAVPYLRDRDIRVVEPGESIEDKERNLIDGIRRHYAAISAQAETYRTRPDLPILATGHLFASGGQTADGDGVRQLYVGSLAQVTADCFPGQHRLSRPRASAYPAKNRRLRNPALQRFPVPMGFGERGAKSVCLVDFAGRQASVECLPVPVFQELERIEGAWEAIESRLKAIAAGGGHPWLEIIYTGSELISDLRDRVEALTEGTDMEILRIKNARIMERALERDDDADTLDALDVYEVFERCLAAHGVPDEQRPDLRLAYRETVASFLEEDPHA